MEVADVHDLLLAHLFGSDQIATLRRAGAAGARRSSDVLAE